MGDGELLRIILAKQEEIKKEQAEIKSYALLGAKKALTMHDASLLTGLSKSHLYKLVCAKAIPYYKSQGGKLTYFEKEELEAWLLNHRVSSNAEAEQKAVNFLVTGHK